MRVLITGGCGFVGRHVAREVSVRGYEQTSADLNTDADVVLDVLDLGAVAECVAEQDVVIHCAAVVGPVPAREDPLRAVEVNVRGTANVVEAARRHGKRVVYLSTATLYGMRSDLKPLHESDTPIPVSHYDATKFAAEVVCHSYRKDFGVDVVAVRTGFVYGPGHSTGEYFVGSALRGEPVAQETGADQPCDFTYVKDLARGLVLAAEKEALPELVYNVTGGVLRTREEFAEAVKTMIPGAEILIGPGVNPAMHLRGPCVLELAKRDFGYVSEFSVEAGIRDWVREAGNRE
jgi:UDP-glucuronate 4-epimerase